MRLPQPYLDTLSQLGIARDYPKNSIIVSEGDEAGPLYIIVSGRVEVYLTDERGRKLTLNVHGPGEYFGEMTFDGGPRSASVLTLEPSRLLAIARDEFERFLGSHPELAVHLIKHLIQRARVLTANVKNLALLDVYGRVARLLLDLAVEQEGKLMISERITHQQIADRVGASREMISRILRDLAIGGYIRIDGRRMIIVKPPPRRW